MKEIPKECIICDVDDYNPKSLSTMNVKYIFDIEDKEEQK